MYLTFLLAGQSLALLNPPPRLLLQRLLFLHAAVSLCRLPSLRDHGKPTLLVFSSVKQSNACCSAESSGDYNATDRKELIPASTVKQNKGTK